MLFYQFKMLHYQFEMLFYQFKMDLILLCVNLECASCIQKTSQGRTSIGVNSEPASNCSWIKLKLFLESALN